MSANRRRRALAAGAGPRSSPRARTGPQRKLTAAQLAELAAVLDAGPDRRADPPPVPGKACRSRPATPPSGTMRGSPLGGRRPWPEVRTAADPDAWIYFEDQSGQD